MDAVLILLTIFGGVSGMIAVSGWARAERIRATGQAGHQAGHSDDPIVAELKIIKQQIGEMQSTSHQFDLSFDESLTRLEQRVNRLETKTATPIPVNADTPSVLKNGQRP